MVSNPNGLLIDSSVQIFSLGQDPNTAVVAVPLPGAPSLATKNSSLVTAALGSLCLRYDTGQLYVKTAAATSANPTGVWTAK